MLRLVLLLMVLIVPSMASAAYLDAATVLRYEQDANGSARLIMRFTGNNNEPIVDRAYPITGDSTLGKLRNWINITSTELNLARTAGTAPQVAPGTVLNGLSPTPPAVVAKTLWTDKIALYKQVCTNGFIGAVATACGTLKSDIEATVQAEFFDVE